MNIIKGKFLMRKARGVDGQMYLTMTGVCLLPKNIEISDKDEMWAAELNVVDSIRFINEYNLQVSPEEFLTGHHQDACEWRRKGK